MIGVYLDGESTMSTKELAEWRHLSKRWALGRAGMAEILRCMELTRKRQADKTRFRTSQPLRKGFLD